MLAGTTSCYYSRKKLSYHKSPKHNALTCVWCGQVLYIYKLHLFTPFHTFPDFLKFSQIFIISHTFHTFSIFVSNSKCHTFTKYSHTFDILSHFSHTGTFIHFYQFFTPFHIYFHKFFQVSKHFPHFIKYVVHLAVVIILCVVVVNIVCSCG